MSGWVVLTIAPGSGTQPSSVHVGQLIFDEALAQAAAKMERAVQPPFVRVLLLRAEEFTP